MIALVVLGLVALTAVVMGIARKQSSSESSSGASASTVKTATTGKNSATTAARGGACAPWAKSAYSKSVMKETGVYLFNETKWKLRVVSTGTAKTFTGTIIASTDLEVSSFKLSDPTAGKVEVKSNTATFELNGTDLASGIDFSIPCKAEQFSVAVTSDGQPWPLDKVTIGKETKAVSNPVIFFRNP